MNLPHKTLLLGATCVALLITVSHAQVIFNDTFDSGKGDWYRASDQDVVSNTSGALRVTRNTGNPTASDGVVGRSFAAQSLAVGETLRLTFDYRQSDAGPGIFRVGLFDFATPVGADNWSGGGIGAFDGYYTFLRHDTFTASLARYELSIRASTLSEPPTSKGTSITTSGGDEYTFIAFGASAPTYLVTFEVTRTSRSRVDTTLRLTNKDDSTLLRTISGSDSAALFETFNSVVLRTAGGTANYDNIILSLISK